MSDSELPEKISKNIKSYFFEFLMLFLAVTLGFFVENQRENYNERQQETQYVQMMLEDIEDDLVEGDLKLKQWENIRLSLDTLLIDLSSSEILNNSNRAHRIWSNNIAYSSFVRNDRTIAQLKNGGGLRLIRVQEVSDAIMKYDQLVRNLSSQQDFMDQVLSNQANYLGLFNFIELKNYGATRPIPLKKGGTDSLNEAYARQQLWQLAISILINRYDVAKAQAIETKRIIREHYQ